MSSTLICLLESLAVRGFELTSEDARSIVLSHDVPRRVWMTERYDPTSPSFISFPISDEMCAYFMAMRPQVIWPLLQFLCVSSGFDHVFDSHISDRIVPPFSFPGNDNNPIGVASAADFSYCLQSQVALFRCLGNPYRAPALWNRNSDGQSMEWHRGFGCFLSGGTLLYDAAAAM